MAVGFHSGSSVVLSDVIPNKRMNIRLEPFLIFIHSYSFECCLTAAKWVDTTPHVKLTPEKMTQFISATANVLGRIQHHVPRASALIPEQSPMPQLGGKHGEYSRMFKRIRMNTGRVYSFIWFNNTAYGQSLGRVSKPNLLKVTQRAKVLIYQKR